MHNLAPFTPPLGPQPPNPHLYAPKQVTLQMKEKVFSLSGDDFTVKTTEGMTVCQCHGKLLSVRDKKKFTDAAGNELFTLKNKTFAISKSFHGESPNGHGFEIKGHLKLMGSKSTVEFVNEVDKSPVELEVKGDWMDRSASITWGGRPVAHINRSYFNVREIFGDKQTYFVTVAANVDLSLIAGICVALDERENEE
ncbi:LURP-one-related [Acrodontium crateriforme]|uniref:LURP-one-related n=1 Tax=Acrodontium crateriforme TaxID=150365 RepID=A0AAQ3M3Y6_9PEZI|nr:LURP-one-related [Acrodontium crateriforme]